VELLPYIPIRDGYTVQVGDGVVEIPLAGGLSKKVSSLLAPKHIVTATWLLKGEEYSKFMGFFRTTIAQGVESFLADLITDIGVPTRHVVRAISGIPKLTQQKGNAYWVSCVLECGANATKTGSITYSLASAASWVYDGVNDRVTMGDVLDKDRLTAFSMGVWVKQDAVGGHFSSKYDSTIDRGWRFYIDATNKLNLSMENQSFPFNRIMVQSTATGQANGVEKHYGVTYNGSGSATGVKLYLNGILMASAIETNGNTLTGTTLSSAPFHLGGANNLGSVGSGATTVRHATVWNRVLTAGEMLQIGTNKYPDISALSFVSALEAWWKVDGSDTATTNGVIDHSGNGLHGTPVNGFGTGTPSEGQITFAGISQNFQVGDSIKVLDTTGTHGGSSINLDGEYVVDSTVTADIITVESPTSISSDWSTLLTAGPYVTTSSTITKVPT
jgi:hypothetical protein